MEREMFEKIAQEAFEDELQKIAKGGMSLSAPLTPGGMGTLTGRPTAWGRAPLRVPVQPPQVGVQPPVSMLKKAEDMVLMGKLEKIAKKGLPPALKAYLEKKKKGKTEPAPEA